MDVFEELSAVLNEAGCFFFNNDKNETELSKKLFLWSDLMKNCSTTNEVNIHPFRNYLTVLYREKVNN